MYMRKNNGSLSFAVKRQGGTAGGGGDVEYVVFQVHLYVPLKTRATSRNALRSHASSSASAFDTELQPAESSCNPYQISVFLNATDNVGEGGENPLESTVTGYSHTHLRKGALLISGQRRTR